MQAHILMIFTTDFQRVIAHPTKANGFNDAIKQTVAEYLGACGTTEVGIDGGRIDDTLEVDAHIVIIVPGPGFCLPGLNHVVCKLFQSRLKEQPLALKITLVSGKRSHCFLN